MATTNLTGSLRYPANSPWKIRPGVEVWREQGVSGNLGPPFHSGKVEWFDPE